MKLENEKRALRVFVASPGDTEELRAVVARVVKKVDRMSLLHGRKTIALVRWETNVVSSVGGYAQDVINKQIPDYDVLVVIFRKRFGTPTPLANSGTEEEFERAYNKLAKSEKPVEIMVYVSDEKFPLSSIDPFQLAMVQFFQKHAHNLGVLVQRFCSVKEFTEQIERALSRIAEVSRLAPTIPGSTAARLDQVKHVTQVGDWHAMTRTLYPQWGTFHEIPILQYLGLPISLKGRFFTSSPYFRFGFKTMMNNGDLFGKDTVQTNDPNVLIYIGLNMDRPWLFLGPFRNGMRIDENIDLIDYSIPRPILLRIDYLDDGAVKFYCDDQIRYQLYNPTEFRQRMLLLAWGDHNYYDIKFTDISIGPPEEELPRVG